MRAVHHADKTAILGRLRARVRALELAGPDTGAPVETVTLGVAEIDQALPWGGLPRGAVHEIAGAEGDGADMAATGFAALLLGRLASAGTALWCLRQADLHAPGLTVFGLDPARLIAVRADSADRLLWAVEEAARTPGLAAVVGEVARVDSVASRRLQLAARESGTACLLLYRGVRAQPGLSAAATRWRVTAMPGAPSARDGFGMARWRVVLERCRGAAARAWPVEWCHETHRLAVVAPLADRPQSAPVPWRAAG